MSPQSIQGTPETNDVALAIVDFVKASKAAYQDGKLDFSDASHFLPLTQSLPKAIEGVSQVPAELRDLDSEEGAKLLALVAAGVGLDSEPAKVRAIVEGSFLMIEGGLKVLEGVRQ